MLSLKNRLSTVEKQLNDTLSNLKTYQTEVQVLRHSKETFQQEFQAQNTDIKRGMATEIDRISEELKRHINHHRNENARIEQQLNHLNEEKTNFQIFLKEIREKLEDIERQVGDS